MEGVIQMNNVFVYGTLRKGERNAQLLKGAKFIAEQCWTNGILYDTRYGYPAMKQSPTSRIYGELYTVTEDELKRIDELEGYTEGGTNNLYERIEQTVYTDNGQCKAFVYVANQGNLLRKKIHYGDGRSTCFYRVKGTLFSILPMEVVWTKFVLSRMVMLIIFKTCLV
jgi:gamma-glutamylcyclotransferase (GGCT)/AIG2-like uncharacterized protein YtfP